MTTTPEPMTPNSVLDLLTLAEKTGKRNPASLIHEVLEEEEGPAEATAKILNALRDAGYEIRMGE